MQAKACAVRRFGQLRGGKVLALAYVSLILPELLTGAIGVIVFLVAAVYYGLTK